MQYIWRLLSCLRGTAGGVVDQRERLDLARRSVVERERAVREHAGLLAGPHLEAPMRA